MTSREHCFLVVRRDAITNASGSGQRTLMVFSLLKRIAPTTVIVIGHDRQQENVSRHRPGHDALHFVDPGTTGRKWRMPHRLNAELGRLSVRWRYRINPDVRDAIAAILGARKSVVAYRYFETFCLAGGAATASTHVVVDADDREDHSVPRRFRWSWGFGRLSARLRQRAARIIHSLMLDRFKTADLVWYAAAEDVNGLKGLATGVLPNAPLPPPHEIPPPSSGSDLLFVGVGNYKPNVDGVRWFIENCWPTIHARHPDSRLRLVGRGRWQLDADFIAAADGVVFVGEVDSLFAEYGRARAAIAPIFAGSGSKIKVIEACSYGRPVIATTHAMRGFGNDLASLLRGGDAPEAFIAACEQILGNPADADDIGARLRAVQQAHYTREAVETRGAEDIRRLIARGAQT